MRVTLKDLAEKTGVSVNTVSHALAGKTDISAATRDRVLAAAAELGYIRNRAASGLRSGKSRTIGVILPDIGNPNFAIMLRGIESFFREKGYTVFVLNTNEDLAAEAAAITAVLGQSPDGIILCPVANDAGNLATLKASGVPFTLIGRYTPGVRADYVVCDDEEGGYLAMKHLLSGGHRNIAFFNGDCRISGAAERLAGARRALAEVGASLPSSHVLTLSVLGGENRRKIRDFFAITPHVTGLVAFSDLLAYEAISVLEELGCRVPEDISVVGFDNICSDYAFPHPLTSVSVRKKTMAHAAAELLFSKMEGEKEEETHIILPTKLLERTTVRPLTQEISGESPLKKEKL